MVSSADRSSPDYLDCPFLELIVLGDTGFNTHIIPSALGEIFHRLKMSRQNVRGFLMTRDTIGSSVR